MVERQGDYAGVCARLEEQERLLKQLFCQQREDLKEQVRLLAEQLAPKDAPAAALVRSKSRALTKVAGRSPEETPLGGSSRASSKDPSPAARSDSRTLKRTMFNTTEDASSTVVRSKSRPFEERPPTQLLKKRTSTFGRTRTSSLGMQHEEVEHVAEVLRRREKHTTDNNSAWEVLCGSNDSDESESEEAAAVDPGTIEPHTRLQACLLPVVQSTWFESLVGSVIVLNAISLGIDINRKIGHLDDPDHGRSAFSTYTEVAFMVIFTVEMLLRLLAEQCEFFAGPNRNWNFFEGFIVLSAWAEPLSFMNVQGTSSLRILRVLRIVRAVRIVRVFRFLHQLRLMLFSLLSCFLSMVWAIMLLFLLMYLFSLYLEEVTLAYLKRHPEGDVADKLREHWHGIVQAMLSLIYSVSGGGDWSVLAKPFMQIWWVHGLMYMLFVLFTTLGIFNILVGIFVAETERVAEWDKNLVVQEEMMKMESTVQTLSEVFSSIDTDNDGHISFDELSQALDDPEVNAYFSHLHIDTTTAGILFGLLDENRDKIISEEEFVAGFLRLKGGARPTELAVLMQHSNHILSRLDVMELVLCNRLQCVEDAMANSA